MSSASAPLLLLAWSFHGRGRRESRWGRGRSWTLEPSQQASAEPPGVGSGPSGWSRVGATWGPDPCLLSWTTCSFESGAYLRLRLPAPRKHFAQGHRFLDVGDEKLQMPNSEARRLLGVGGGRRYEPGKLHLGVGTPPGGSRSLSHLPPPRCPQRSRWPQKVCAPLGWTATASEKVLSSWPAGVNVCLSSSPWARSAEAHPGILCFDSRVCGGPSGPLGLQVGSGGWAPPAHPRVRWDQGSVPVAWVPWAPLG